MGIFDNASSITFDGDEVKSLKIGNGVIWEADSPTLTIICKADSSTLLTNVNITFNDTSKRTDSEGKVVFDGKFNGRYEVKVDTGSRVNSIYITVSEGQTSIEAVFNL